MLCVGRVKASFPTRWFVCSTRAKMVLVHALARAGSLLLALMLRTDAIYVASDQEAAPTYCTVYTHMFKSGGSSIKQKLLIAARKDRGPDPLFCNRGGASDHDCVKAAPNATVLTGGNVEKLRYALHEMGRECEFFTMLRHPIDRAISAFFYCPDDHDIQKRPAEWCGYSDHPTPATKRLIEFLRNVWGNMAFRQLSASLFCHPGLPCSKQQRRRTSLADREDKSLLKEVEAILATYNAVGVMEHWDLSMQLFDANVKSPVRSWEANRHANEGHMSRLRDHVYRWAHANPEIHAIVATDMLLYGYASSLFWGHANKTVGG